MIAYLYPSVELGLTEKFFELKKRVSTVGRHPNNDVSLLLESVSRFHSKIEQQESEWVVIDLNSSNGTYVNGDRLSAPVVLAERDTITFGRADFTFSFLSPDERRRRGEESSGRHRKADSHTSSVNIVPDDVGASTILSTHLNIESTPLPGSELIELQDVESQRKANQRLLTLYRLSEVIRSSVTSQDVMSNVMDLIFEVLPVDRGVILMLEPPDNLPEPKIVRFRHADPGAELTISRTIIHKCLDERVAIVSRDARIDSRFSASDSILVNDIRSTMCVPLVSKSSLIGIIFVDTKESVREFNEDDLAFFASIANDLAITLHNMSLAEDNIKNERLAAVGQTIAGLAHNIKNILQLARGGIELMDMAIGKKQTEQVESYWPVVRRGIDRMQSLTQEMLDYSRQTTPELLEANVNEVVNDMARSFEKDCVEPGVEIELQLSPEVPNRLINPDGLFKSLMNLVGNAVDAFGGVGGRIVIRTYLLDNTIFLKVEDNGPGIPKAKLGKVFMPFFTTKGSRGTGLGLSMTRKYVEDMRGMISVESQEGVGTTFTIALPPLVQHLQFDLDPNTDA